MSSMKKSGQMIVKALSSFSVPVTLDRLVKYIVDQSTLPENEIRSYVKQVLSKGLHYGYVDKNVSKYFLTSPMPAVARKRKTPVRRSRLVKQEGFVESDMQHPKRSPPARQSNASRSKNSRPKSTNPTCEEICAMPRLTSRKTANAKPSRTQTSTSAATRLPKRNAKTAGEAKRRA